MRLRVRSTARGRYYLVLCSDDGARRARCRVAGRIVVVAPRPATPAPQPQPAPAPQPEPAPAPLPAADVRLREAHHR
jgi:hypothetical protein